jgi:hypothetical protein
LERRSFVDNLRYFKFVGSKEQAKGYDKPRPKVGVIYSEEVKIAGIDVFWYAISIQDREINAEWQEVYVSDDARIVEAVNNFKLACPIEEHCKVESQTPIKTALRNAREKLAELEEKYSNNLPQKTFPPDAVTLDTYEGGKWYDVREVLPDERFDEMIFVELYSLEIKQAVWDDEDQKFIRVTGEVCDDVKEWRAYDLGE